MRTTTSFMAERSASFHTCIILLSVGVSLAAGCASIPANHAPAADFLTQEARDCAGWFSVLDQTIDEAGVRDASAHRIAEFPYLRVDRFSSSFRNAAAEKDSAFAAWSDRLRSLDLAARKYEISNLPPAALKTLGMPETNAVVERVARCSKRLSREELADRTRRESLLSSAVVPDDYAEWVRDTGIYAVASVPFSIGVDGWHRQAEDMFRRAADGVAHDANMRRYDPDGRRADVTEIRAILARSKPDGLGIPQVAAQDADVLFRTYAPRYEIETTGAHDRFGPLVWTGGRTPSVDAAKPVVYTRLAYTRYGERSLVQLVYTVWFPERPADRTLDLLAGTLDGLVFRVTLDADGTPLVFDTIHPCGCYHMFFPTASMKPVPARDPREEWAFIPSTLPQLGLAQRVAIRIASRTHYLVGVRIAPEGDAEPYGFASDDDLRALPTPGGGTKSVFGPDALVVGTERAERALFWPMGIASPGTMRQWGRHPTAFIGRRHFDDADLIEKRFAR
jgi:hypothetical protein